MAVAYRRIDGELVSAEWFSVLNNMRNSGVPFRVNEGKRTMQRQWYFYNCYRSGRCNGGNLAAYPSDNAPHIRTGRIDHANDFWNDQAAMNGLARRNCRPARTVRSESWHVECPAAALRAFHARYHRPDPLRHLRGNDKRAAERLLYHRLEMIREGKSGKGRRYRKHLKWARFWKANIEKRLDNLAKRGHRDSRTHKVLSHVLRAKSGRA